MTAWSILLSSTGLVSFSLVSPCVFHYWSRMSCHPWRYVHHNPQIVFVWLFNGRQAVQTIGIVRSVGTQQWAGPPAYPHCEIINELLRSTERRQSRIQLTRNTPWLRIIDCRKVFYRTEGARIDISSVLSTPIVFCNSGSFKESSDSNHTFHFNCTKLVWQLATVLVVRFKLWCVLRTILPRNQIRSTPYRRRMAPHDQSLFSMHSLEQLPLPAYLNHPLIGPTTGLVQIEYSSWHHQHRYFQRPLMHHSINQNTQYTNDTCT